MDELYEELLEIIKQTPHLKERLFLANSQKGAKELFLMACYFDNYEAVNRHRLYGRLSDEVIDNFYVFMERKNYGF